MTTVLVHPLPLDGSVWADVVEGVDDDVVVVSSLYDFGDTMEAWAAAVLDLLDPGTHTMVGNSVGASCAAEVAYLAPERVERVVMIGGKLGHRPEPSRCEDAVRVLTEEGLESAWDTFWRPLFGPAVDDAVRARAKQCLLGLDVDDIVRGVRVFHSRPDRSDLGDRWTGRLDVVCGAHDRSPSPEVARLAIEGAPDGRFHLVEHVGHYVPLEAPERAIP